MRILWLDLNCSYAHSSLALPALHAQVMNRSDIEWAVVRTTTGEAVGSAVDAIYAYRPDVVAATAWLFTHEHLLHILARVKALLPQAVVILGGPEFLGDNEAYLGMHRVDYNEHITGKRTEGSIYGTFNLARRIGQTVGLGISFFALDWVGYQPKLEVQTAGTIFGFKILCVLVPALFILGSWAAFKFVWNITPEIRSAMAAKKAQQEEVQ